MENGAINLLNFDTAAMQSYFAELKEAPFRASQVIKWIHQQGVTDFQSMSNLSKSLRSQLQDKAQIKLPEIATVQHSADGTRKWLLRLDDGNSIETVFIPERTRGTLCVSSQVGCALNCRFCSTAQQGFNRNLSVAEIIGQVWLAVRELAAEGGKEQRQVTNVVMMGMGEPLLNFDNVVSAMNLMMDDFAYGLSKRRVTLSTSGVVPMMTALAACSDVSLAVSLHAPNDALRDVLVPINKKYPLRELMAVCRDYFRDEPRRKITFEYVMLDNINDSPAHARQLIKLLDKVPAKMNLIPFNPFPNTIYQCSKPAVIERFAKILQDAGMNTIVRKTRGDDIDAACGQLAGQFTDRTQRRRRLQQQFQRIPVYSESGQVASPAGE